MDQRRIVAAASVLLFAFASPAFAAGPMTLQQYDALIEKVAPMSVPPFPGRTLCVCQSDGDSNTTHVGYLHAYHVDLPFNQQAVNIRCVFPVFEEGVQSAFGQCIPFQVIK